MSELAPKYERSLEDELDWSLLEQLHRVTLQTSAFCFRTKQICVTVDVAIAGLLARYLENNLGHSVFVAGLLIPAIFWALDSVGYYYQVKVRLVMDEIRAQIRERNRQDLILTDNVSRVEVIEGNRGAGGTGTRFRNAMFNHSMWLYLILALIDLILWGVFTGGIIQ